MGAQERARESGVAFVLTDAQRSGPELNSWKGLTHGQFTPGCGGVRSLDRLFSCPTTAQRALGDRSNKQE